MTQSAPQHLENYCRVQLNDGRICIVIDRLLYNREYNAIISLDRYNEKMQYIGDLSTSCYDIVKIWECPENINAKLKVEIVGDLLWSRQGLDRTLKMQEDLAELEAIINANKEKVAAILELNAELTLSVKSLQKSLAMS